MTTQTIFQPGCAALLSRVYRVRWHTRSPLGIYSPEYWSMRGNGGIAQVRFDHAEMIAQLMINWRLAENPLWVEIIDAETEQVIAVVCPTREELLGRSRRAKSNQPGTKRAGA